MLVVRCSVQVLGVLEFPFSRMAYVIMSWAVVGSNVSLIAFLPISQQCAVCWPVSISVRLSIEAGAVLCSVLLGFINMCHVVFAWVRAASRELYCGTMHT